MPNPMTFNEELLYLLERLYNREMSISSVHNVVLTRFDSQRSELEEEKKLAVATVLEQTKDHLEDV